jgi:hypothetical protein
MQIIKGNHPPPISQLSVNAQEDIVVFADMQREARIAANRVSNFKNKECNHVVFQKTNSSDAWEHNPDGLGSARCLVCGSSFGWACPDSKDGVCHAGCEIDDDGFVTLIDQSRVKPTEEEWGFGEESCVFCGHPEERK